jgi:ABC-2 type transport system permease protein
MWRKYVKTAQMTARGYVSEGPLFIFYFGLKFLWVAVLLAVWRAVFEGRGMVDGMTLDTVLTYTLIAAVFGDQMMAETRIVNTMWDGTIATHLLQPLPVEGIFTAEMFGEWSIGFGLVSIPLLFMAPSWGINPLPADLMAGLLFVPSLALAIAIGVALDFLYGALTMALNINIWILDQFRVAVGTVLSGAFLPLQLMPWGLGKVFAWLPFASMGAAPLQIYTGTGEPARWLALQVFWCVVLWPCARWAWNANREKLTSFGG